jgi:NADH-quinone oxidoreductase subunit J
MTLFFYLFASMLVISSLLVVSSKNPVYSVLWLIFTFCNAAGLFILIGAEFLAMMLVVIYVGAVAVLFLFVIMMLNVNFAKMREASRKNLTAGAIVALILFIDLGAIIMVGTKSISLDHASRFAMLPDVGNVYAIGRVLYTDFVLPFQIAGLILFVAMVSCISLTLRSRGGVKRQDVLKQLSRNKSNSLKLEKIGAASGVEGLKYDDE